MTNQIQSSNVKKLINLPAGRQVCHWSFDIDL